MSGAMRPAGSTRATPRSAQTAQEILRQELLDQQLASQQLLAEAAIKNPVRNFGATFEPAAPNQDGGNLRDSSRANVDSIPGPFLGIFKSVWGLVLLMITLAAIATSVYHITHWPAMITGVQSGAVNCSSSVSIDFPRLPAFDFDRRVVNLEDDLERTTVQMENFAHQIVKLEDRHEPTIQLADLRGKLTDLEKKVDKLLQVSEAASQLAAVRPKARQINWLSFDLGARVMPNLCSPTEYLLKAKKITIQTQRKPWGWSSLLGLPARTEVAPIERKPPAKFEKINYGPNSVLQPWRENEPRYCTSDKKVQLAVKLTRRITPHNLVVEYYRKDEVTAVGAAPKEVELWIPVPDKAARTAVVSAITDIYPDILAAAQTTETADSPAQKDALDPVWVPVGRWTYDIFANQIGHTFDILLDLESLGIVVDEIAVRVNSNWANGPVTCLVRVRLHGFDKSGLYERLDPR